MNEQVTRGDLLAMPTAELSGLADSMRIDGYALEPSTLQAQMLKAGGAALRLLADADRQSVTRCGDCPFVGVGGLGDDVCNLLPVRNRDVTRCATPPDNCPLRTAPVLVVLRTP